MLNRKKKLERVTDFKSVTVVKQASRLKVILCTYF